MKSDYSHIRLKIMNTESGFTLIEVLVALVVLSVGLLGLAALQATGLKNNQSAYYRSVAIHLAYNMADRMRANVVEAQKGTASKYVTLTPDDATPKSTCTTLNGNCTAADMAENDLYEWNDNLGELPNAQGNILHDGGSIYTISIQWDEARDGAIDSKDPNFLTSFKL